MPVRNPNRLVVLVSKVDNVGRRYDEAIPAYFKQAARAEQMDGWSVRNDYRNSYIPAVVWNVAPDSAVGDRCISFWSMRMLRPPTGLNSTCQIQ